MTRANCELSYNQVNGPQKELNGLAQPMPPPACTLCSDSGVTQKRECQGTANRYATGVEQHFDEMTRRGTERSLQLHESNSLPGPASTECTCDGRLAACACSASRGKAQFACCLTAPRIQRASSSATWQRWPQLLRRGLSISANWGGSGSNFSDFDVMWV